METLFTPFQAGEIALDNRIVMAPLTRNRALGQVPTERMVEYYRQRANPADRKSTRLNSSHSQQSRMPSSA